MRYYKQIVDGYITLIGTGGSVYTEITEDEYNAILDLIHDKPKATETTDYRLREDLTWEEYPVDPPDPDPEIDDSELLDILMGVTE